MNSESARSLVVAGLAMVLVSIIPTEARAEVTHEFCATVEEAFVDPLDDLVSNCTDLSGDCYPHTLQSARMRAFIWIIRGVPEGGQGLVPGVSDAQLDTALAQIETDYAPAGISFAVAGKAFLDDQALFEGAPGAGTAEEIRAYILANHQDKFHGWAIDLFLLPADPSKRVMGGAAETVPGTWMFGGGKRFYATNFVSHELGHCLGLFHTFESAFGGGQDFPLGFPTYVEGSCRYAGDRICDTPSDPYSRHVREDYVEFCWHPLIDANCEYTVTVEEFACDPTLPEAERDNYMTLYAYYAPDTHNIMSYYIVPESFGEDAVACPSTFTPLQGDRMLACIERAPLLQAVRVPEFVDVSSSTGITYPGSEPYSAVGFDYNGAGEDDLTVTFGDAAGEEFRWERVEGTLPTFFSVNPFQSPISRRVSRPLLRRLRQRRGSGSVRGAPERPSPVPQQRRFAGDATRTSRIPWGWPSLADSSWAGSWGDFDRDGWVDLYVVRARGRGAPRLIVGAEDRLLRSKLGAGEASRT